jgi:hypothetical protein
MMVTTGTSCILQCNPIEFSKPRRSDCFPTKLHCIVKRTAVTTSNAASKWILAVRATPTAGIFRSNIARPHPRISCSVLQLGLQRDAFISADGSDATRHALICCVVGLKRRHRCALIQDDGSVAIRNASMSQLSSHEARCHPIQSLPMHTRDDVS